VPTNADIRKLDVPLLRGIFDAEASPIGAKGLWASSTRGSVAGPAIAKRPRLSRDGKATVRELTITVRKICER